MPLLISRQALEQLGMHFHLRAHTADFESLGIKGYRLGSTEVGHPTVKVTEWGIEGPLPEHLYQDVCEVRVAYIAPETAHQQLCQTTTTDQSKQHSICMSNDKGESEPVVPVGLGECVHSYSLFELSQTALTLLTGTSLMSYVSFMSWLEGYEGFSDFWIQSETEFIRVHVIPRRNHFTPVESSLEWGRELNHVRISEKFFSNRLEGKLMTWVAQRRTFC